MHWKSIRNSLSCINKVRETNNYGIKQSLYAVLSKLNIILPL